MQTISRDAANSQKFLSSWWVVGILGILGMVAVLMALGIIPGLTPVPIKPVSMIYPAAADKAQLTLFVQPPLATLNRDDPTQQLFVQWMNHSTTDLPLPELQAIPSTCFALQRQTPILPSLPKGATQTTQYLLSLKSGCPGQVPLTLVSLPAASGQPASGILVTTSPIVITSSARLDAERLVRILSSLAAPIALAFLALLIDRYQKRRDQDQKNIDDERNQTQKKIDDERELAQQDLQRKRELAQQKLQRKLEVWKLVFPIIDSYIRRHYVLISRQMDLIRSEMEENPINPRYLMVEVIILRAAFDRLGDEIGGFNFQNRSAEEICSILSNHLLSRLQAIAGDRLCYARSRRVVTPLDLVIEADDKLTALAENDAAMTKFQLDFANGLIVPATMEELSRLLAVTIQFLDFENNVLWYPWWYSTAPTLDFDQKFADLGLSQEDVDQLQILIKILESEVPKKCRAKAKGAP